jgi:hypothetical protein
MELLRNRELLLAVEDLAEMSSHRIRIGFGLILANRAQRFDRLRDDRVRGCGSRNPLAEFDRRWIVAKHCWPVDYETASIAFTIAPAVNYRVCT